MQKLVVVFVALCVAAACSAGPPAAQKSSQRAPGSAEYGFQRIMTAQTLTGQPLPQTDERPILLVFFASWCHVCQRELQTLGELRQAYPQMRIIGVNAYEEFRGFSNRQRLETSLQTHAPWLREVVHADKAMLQDFGGVPKIPTLFLYDKVGQVVAEFRRGRRRVPTREELEESIIMALGR
jgi:thiol-disulfide isomerase/thioredoxin